MAVKTMADYIKRDDAVGWISVKDALPEQNTHVLIVWVNHDPLPYYERIKDKPFVASGVYYNGLWYWWSDGVEALLAEYGGGCIFPVDNAIEITHWMPLPAPPEEVQNDG